MGVLIGHWGFLTGDLEDIVILDVMNDLILPQGIYPESLVLISRLEVCQEGGIKKAGTWRTLGGFLTETLRTESKFWNWIFSKPQNFPNNLSMAYCWWNLGDYHAVVSFSEHFGAFLFFRFNFQKNICFNNNFLPFSENKNYFYSSNISYIGQKGVDLAYWEWLYLSYPKK